MDREETPQAILDSMAGASGVRYTGSGALEQKIESRDKFHYHCNYNKLIDMRSRLRLAWYKILNQNQAANNIT